MSYIIAEYKFDNILYDLIPEFNEGFEYTYEDILEGNVTTRTIYSNELPTLLRFGNSDTSGETGDSNKYNSLLEVLYLASSEITYAGLMFHRCANVSYICPFILTNKNNSLHGIFSGCHALTSLDVSNFDTSNVTDMSYAFYTNNLIELDLSDWDTSNVTNMNHILYNCQNLKTLNISNWNLNNVDNIGWFVNQCNNLNEIIMNDSDYNSVNKIISELPITTNGSKCNFCIGGVDDISKVNIREGWDIMNQYKIAEYKFNNTLYNLIPEFNEGFTYTYEDVVDGGVTTRTIYSDSLPTLMKFGGTVDSNRYSSLIEVFDLNTKELTDCRYMFSRCYNVKNIRAYWNTSKVNNIECMFYNCYSLTSLDLSNFNTSEVTNMGQMFYDCFSLTSLNLSNFDTSNVTNMNNMFNGCTNLTTLDVSKFDTRKVNNISYMFYYCHSLTSLDVSNWDISNVTSMVGIFNDCYSLTSLDVSNWNTSKITSLNNVFSGCDLLKPDLSNWDTSRVNNIGWLFDGYGLQGVNIKQFDLSYLNFSNVVFAEGAFAFNSNIRNLILPSTPFTLHNVHILHGIDCGFITDNNNLITLDFGGLNLSNTIDDISYVLRNNPKLRYIRTENPALISDLAQYFPARTEAKQGYLITKTNVPDEIRTLLAGKYWNVVDLDEVGIDVAIYKFDKSIYKSLVPEFDDNFVDWFMEDVVEDEVNAPNIVTRTIRSMGGLPTLMRFGTNISLDSEYVAGNEKALISVEYLNTDNLTNMDKMFKRCSNLININTEGWNISNVTTVNSAFMYCDNLTSLDVSNFNTSNVTNMTYMFYNCNKLTSLDVSNWETSNVTSMHSMFNACRLLTSLDVSNWETSNVTSMQAMFNACSKLTTLDVSNFNTSNVTSMAGMFNNCKSLTSLDVSNFNTSKVTNMGNMFYGCINLNSIIMNNSDYSSVNKIIAQLLTRTTDSMGTLNIAGVNDISQVDIVTAEYKFWNVENRIKIVEYKFTNSSDLVPVFNEGFTYTYEDVVDGGVTTRIIYADSLPTIINFTGKANLLEVYYLETSNLTTAVDLFYNCTGLTYVDLRNSDFSKVESIERMFNTCTNLLNIDGLNDLDISNVGNMGGVFSDCRKLPEINVSNWNVSKVTNFGAAFRRCYELTSIDLSNWDTSSATIMSGVFTNCSKLTEIDLSNWKMDNVTTINQMFYGCSKLTSVKLFNHINSGVNTTYLFTNCKVLNKIEIYNSDFNTINSIISVLPEKTSAAPGTLNIKGVDKISQVNLTSALSKNWVIIRDQGVVTNVYAGDKMIFNKLVQNKEIKNIYIGNVKIL